VGWSEQPGGYAVVEQARAVDPRLEVGMKQLEAFASAVVIAAFIVIGAPAQASPGPASAAPATSFGDGTFEVGKDIAPGTYATNVPADSFACYWERDKALDGSPDSIIANDNLNPSAHGLVLIKPTDKGFTSDGCGTWTAAPSTGTGQHATSFGEGTYAVGTDIVPGTYTTNVPADSDGCYWERDKSLDGSPDSIIDNNNLNGGAHALVRLIPSDEAFKSQGCGTWHKRG
jgi:hypothetical protein